VLGKGAKDPEDAPMNSETYHLIQEWIAARPVPSPYIFTSFAGRGGAARATDRPIDPSAIWRTVQEYATACGLAHIKPHDLRRFFGTTIVAKTGDIRKAQKSLRHKSIETTARYYVLNEVDPTVSEGMY
jgi:integrase